MKKILAIILAAVMLLGLAACNNSQQIDSDIPTEPVEEGYTVGVLVYNIADEEVIGFREYLTGYIASCFDNVSFVYSESVRSVEDEMNFIRQCGENGVDGIMSFRSFDVAAEADLCAEYDMYYMLASGSITDEQYEAAADNAYFVGVVGPGEDAEEIAGARMAEAVYNDRAEGDDTYFILSGGAATGNAMHLNRAIGMINKLQELYGVSFDAPSETIAANDEGAVFTAGDLTVVVRSGLIAYDEFLEPALASYREGNYSNILSVLPLVEFSQEIMDKDVNVGIVDCYSTRNLQLYNNGVLTAVTGKYSALIGPSFALMYNAITGHADQFRDNGRAVRIAQGFWESTDVDDFAAKYTLATSIEENAYNYEDLFNVCVKFNENATLQDLIDLAAAYSYQDVVARRGIEN